MGKKRKVKERARAKAKAKVKGKRKSKRASKERTSPLPIPDRRAMERTLADLHKHLDEQVFESEEEVNAYLQQLLGSDGSIPDVPARTPLEEAQNLMYDAWEARGSRRVQLARQSLEISPDCADAYVLLAEETARSVAEARQFYEKGVAASERTLGPEIFEEDLGHFWGILSTRPYMRARRGLADCLWAMGEHDEAIQHYRDMLCLNPGDNQGIRYTLAACLLETSRDDELRVVFENEEYAEDCSADWLFTWALLEFRRCGDCAKARARLKTALEWNPHVPEFLLGRRRLPRHLPEYIEFGGESEAINYCVGFAKGWQATPGAIEWLECVMRGRPEEPGP